MRNTVFATLLLAGCATTGSMVQSTPSTVTAYQAVRSGEQPTAKGGDIAFCAGPTSVVAQRVEGRPSDQWATQIHDHAIADNVRGALRSDPALERLDVRVNHGAVHLDGNVASAAEASKAIATSLQVAGVVMVQARLFSPDEPSPPPAGTAQWCG
jgi:osmotically-inducible protein OsmY